MAEIVSVANWFWCHACAAWYTCARSGAAELGMSVLSIGAWRGKEGLTAEKCVLLTARVLWFPKSRCSRSSLDLAQATLASQVRVLRFPTMGIGQQRQMHTLQADQMRISTGVDATHTYPRRACVCLFSLLVSERATTSGASVAVGAGLSLSSIGG